VNASSIPLTKQILEDTDVKIWSVIVFHAGNSTTMIKMQGAVEVAKAVGTESEMTINIGKEFSDDWEYV